MKTRTNFSLLPVFIILAVALVVFFPALKRWEPISSLFSYHPVRTAPAGPVKVWVNTRSGLYYCSASALFGRITPGRYLEQAAALQDGYRPAEGQPCH